VSYERPYLDSSVYIAAIKSELGRVDTARSILKDAERGRIKICASTFVVVEVNKAPGYQRLSDDDEKTVADFFLHDYFEWAELDHTLAREARRLARELSLKPADAIHLASAIALGADCFLKWDRHYPEGDYHGLHVCEPYALERQEEFNLSVVSTSSTDLTSPANPS